MDRLHQFFHHRLGEVPERHRGEIGETQVENLGREPEQAPFEADVAQAHQREQDAAGARTCEAGCFGNFGERLLRPLRIECADDGQPACEGLHVGIAGFFGGKFGGGHAGKRKRSTDLKTTDIPQISLLERLIAMRTP